MRFGIATLLAVASLASGDDDASARRLLDLNVIALGKNNQPVTNLTIEDFEVTDNGRPQPLVFFRHRDASRWEAPHLAPNEFSNRSGSAIPHATVILFDFLNESFATRGYATNQLIQTLEKLKNADYLYLYILDVEGRLFGVHALAAGEENPEPGAAPWTKGIKPLLDRARRDTMKERPYDIDVAVRVQLTFAGLNNLAVQLSRVPGRKNIVWITDGVPVALGPMRSDTGDWVDFTPQMRLLSQSLERSGVAIYPVRELFIGSPDGIGKDSAGAGETGGAGTGIQSVATLDEIADVTGGRRTQGKDLGEALTQAMNDVRISYQIGYYAPENNWDNKFHKVRVTCKRKGVRIQAKSGYYAWNDPPGVESEQAIAQLAPAQFDAAEIGLHGTLSIDQKDKTIGHLDARIDAHDVAFGETGETYEAQLKIVVIGYTADGRAEGTAPIALPLHYTVEDRAKALKDGIPVVENLHVSKFEKIRLIVLDRGSNAAGSLTMPVPKP